MRYILITILLLSVFANCAWISHPKTTTVNNNVDTANIIIQGKILNYHTNLPVKKLELEIKGTSFKCITDVDGRFKFQLPDSFNAKTIVIKTGYLSADFLDITSSIVPDKKVVIDSLPFKKELILYRYPVEKITPIDVTGGHVTRCPAYPPSPPPHPFQLVGDTTSIQMQKIGN